MTHDATHSEADLEDLLSMCIDAGEERGPAAVDEILRANPAHAPDLRRLLDSLEQLGIVKETRSTPARLGEFTLLRKIGQGGMGIVYLARQESVGRLVAIKTVHPQFAANERLAARFRREAEALAKLSHEHVVRVIGSGEDDGQLFTAMEFVPGRGLDEVLRTSRPERRETVAWARDIARALQVVHEASVVHRDVKPSNIRITPEGRAVLLDFGLARDANAVTLTLTSSFQGSPHYASPEQISAGHPVGPSSDVYSLGITLYEAATGNVPFAGDTTEQIFDQILHAPLPSTRTDASALPRDLETILNTATERDATRRYASAAAFADDLDAFLELRPVIARPPSFARRSALWARRNRALAATLVTAGLAVLVFAAALLWIGKSRESRRLHRARMLQESARAKLESVGAQRDRLLATVAKLESKRRELPGTYHDASTWKAHIAERKQVDAEILKHENAATEAVAMLDRAAQTAPELDEELRELRTRVFLERWRFAAARGDTNAARAFAGFVRALDRDGVHAPELEARRTIRIETKDPGARAWAFRYEPLSTVADDGDERLVPVPYRGVDPSAPAPGTACLRVTRAVPPLENGDLILQIAGWPVSDALRLARAHAGAARGDRIVSVDGKPVHSAIDVANFVVEGSIAESRERTYVVASAGGDKVEFRSAQIAMEAGIATPRVLASSGNIGARVWRNGKSIELELQPGSDIVPTAAPLIRCARAYLGKTPVQLDVSRGAWIVLLTTPDCESMRIPFDVPGTSPFSSPIELLPADTSPRGFARILDPRDGTSFWLSVREVVNVEYAEFLNQPDTLREIRAKGLIRFPRHPDTRSVSTGLWRRQRGRFSFAPAPTHAPVIGVSLDDARAFCSWMTKRSLQAGRGWRYRIPTQRELEIAAQAGRGRHRRFVFGHEFQPTWFKSLYSRPRACVEPVMMYPVDESAWGIFDLTGSVREWTETPFSTAFVLFGGSWIHSAEYHLRDLHYTGADSTQQSTGFRVIAERAD